MHAKQTATPKSYIIVWGASGGVGREIVGRLAEAGMGVIAYVRDHTTVHTLEQSYPGIVVRTFQIEEAFYIEEAAYLRLQGYCIIGMVDCVGSVTTDPSASLTQRLEDFLKPNLYHQYYAALTFRDILRPDSSIVFISSVRALTGVNNQNIEYAFAKAALENLTKSLVYMLAEQRIRVNTIRPTPIVGTKISGMWSQSLVQQLTEQSVFNKLLSPADIADITEFLLSSKAASLTGTVIDASNGFSLLQ
jgi:3-oxoacyl-[acyl-carrier protein] reductase